MRKGNPIFTRLCALVLTALFLLSPMQGLAASASGAEPGGNQTGAAIQGVFPNNGSHNPAVYAGGKVDYFWYTAYYTDEANGTIKFIVKMYDGSPYDYAYIAGDFNGWGDAAKDERYRLNWQEDPNEKGVWKMMNTITFSSDPKDPNYLAPGKHEYKFMLHIKDTKDFDWIDANGFVNTANSSFEWKPSVPQPPTPPQPAEGWQVKVSSDTVTANHPVELVAVLQDAYGQQVPVENAVWQVSDAGGTDAKIVNGNFLQVTNAPAGAKITVKAVGENAQAERIITVAAPADGTMVHYFRRDRDYSDWNFWNWGAGDQSVAVNPTQNGDMGIAACLPEGSNVIVRKGEWVAQTGTYHLPAGAKNVYLIDGNPKVYTSLAEAILATNAQMKAAIMDSKGQIRVELTDAALAGVTFSLWRNGADTGITAVAQGNQVLVDTRTLKDFDPSDLLEIRADHMFHTPCQVTMRNVLDSYVYNGNDMGAVYGTENGSLSVSGVKVWAPTAIKAELMLYDNPAAEKTSGTSVLMVRDAATGIWTAAQPADAYGKYYLFRLTFRSAEGERITYAVDPYAMAVSQNGKMGCLLDIVNDPATYPDQNKAAFDKTQRPHCANMQDAIIYEMHVRDFTINKAWGGNAEYAGKYLGVAQSGTAYTHNGIKVPTGLDHLKNLGITHVHLLPTYDFGSVDETKDGRNWGYDPVNYNVPEGSYSTNSADPATRIREFRQMVMSLHDNGIGVILDQVYNHMYSTENMDAIVPGYYFRSWADGTYSNGSGCGNEVASERPMVSKFIVDSNRHWLEHYKVDGLRFDLMALLDQNTMRQVRNLDTGAIMYGEPWKAANSPLPSEQETAKNQNFIAFFNDTFRDGLRGNNSPSKGFVNGGGLNSAAVQNGLNGRNFAAPTINYVEAHDNYTIWDQIITNEGQQTDGYRPADMKEPYMQDWRVKKAVLANSMVLMARGVPFFQGGSEFLRTKNGDHNSYQSDDGVNDIEWADKVQYQDVFTYFQGLIRLRKDHPALRRTTPGDANSVTNLMYRDDLILQQLRDNQDDTWKNVLIIYNGSTDANGTEITWLPEISGEWKIAVHDGQVMTDTPLGTVQMQGSKPVNFRVPSSSMTVLYDDSEGTVNPPQPGGNLEWDYLFADQSADYMEPMEPSSQDKVTVRFRAGAGQVTKAFVSVWDSKNQKEILYPMTKAPEAFYAGKGYDAQKVEFWEATLPECAYIRYYNFVIHGVDGQMVWLSGGASAQSHKGITTTPQDNRGFWIVPNYKTSKWAKESVFYQIMVDRFRDGDKTNNRLPMDISQSGNPSEITEWGGAITNGLESDMIWNNQFFGGDLIGVQEAIPYLKDTLGVDAVYLMPIFQSGSDHKYDTDDYRFVDKNFGGNQSLIDLSQALHDNGMHLMLDGVFNHTSSEHIWMKNEADKNSHYFIGDYVDNNGVPVPGGFFPWHGFTNLAKLNYANSIVQQHINDVGSMYLKAPYNIDGWRLDAADDVNSAPCDNDQFTEKDHAANLAIWESFRNAVSTAAPEKDAFLLGEHWKTGNAWFNGKAWDGKMNYSGFYVPLVEKNINMAELGTYVRNYCTTLPYQAVLSSTNSISTHDKPRFLNLKEQNLMEIYTAMQMTYPGIPMVYYGDEIGTKGAKSGDPYNRGTFNWDSSQWDTEILKDHHNLIAARKAHKDAFVYGAFEEITSNSSGNYIAYARYSSKDQGLVVLNAGGTLQNVQLDRLERYGLGDGDALVDVLTGAVYTVSGGAVTVNTAARSAAVLVKNGKCEEVSVAAPTELSDNRTFLKPVENVMYTENADGTRVLVSWNALANPEGAANISVRLYQGNRVVAEKLVGTDAVSAVLAVPQDGYDSVQVRVMADRSLRTDAYADSGYAAATADATGAKMAQRSASLKDTIEINFYLTLTAPQPGDKMVFTMQNKNKVIEVPFAKAVNKNGQYMFSCPVPAKEMTDRITAQYVKADGTAGVKYTYSVEQYAEQALKLQDPSVTNAVVAMLNYSAAAQKYFGYHTERLANRCLTPEQKVLPEVTLDKNQWKFPETAVDGITYQGGALSLEYATGLLFFFKLDAGQNIGDFEFTYEDGGRTYPASVSWKSGKGLYRVEIPAIFARNLGNAYVLTVKNVHTGQTMTIQFSAYAYCGAAMETNMQRFGELSRSLYQYCEATKAYAASAVTRMRKAA